MEKSSDPPGLAPAAALGLPAGITFLARPFDEGTLLAMAHAYEQTSQLRAPPMLFPDCTGGSVLSQTAG